MLTSFLFLFLHNFYVSLLTLQYKADHHSLEYTLKLVAHDTEKAISLASGIKKFSFEKQTSAVNDSLLQQYINTRCLIEIDGLPIHPVFIGYELDNEELYVFQEIPVATKPAAISIYNALLVELYDRQVNEVKIKGLGPDAGKIFTRELRYQQVLFR